MNKSTQGLCQYFIVSNVGTRVPKTANHCPIANVHQSKSGIVSGLGSMSPLLFTHFLILVATLRLMNKLLIHFEYIQQFISP